MSFYIANIIHFFFLKLVIGFDISQVINIIVSNMSIQIEKLVFIPSILTSSIHHEDVQL